MYHLQRYDFKEVIGFLPGLDAQLPNFEIWLQDAWDIIMFNGSRKEEGKFVELENSYIGDGDILIWIASFYTIYSEFYSLINSEEIHEINYVDFYSSLSDWDSFLSAYLSKDIQIAVNKYIFLKDSTCQVPLFNHIDCVAFDVPERVDYLYNYYFYKEDDIISIPYEVLESEIESRISYIKTSLYGYFNALYSTCLEERIMKEAIMQFMYGLHWFLNYTYVDISLLTDRIGMFREDDEILKQHLLDVFNECVRDIFKECPYYICFDFNLFLKLKDYSSYIFIGNQLLHRIPNIIEERNYLDEYSLDKTIKKQIEIEIQEQQDTIIRTYNWILSWKYINGDFQDD